MSGGFEPWSLYLDSLDEALKAVAIAVSEGQPPAWPAGLVHPNGPLPLTLAERKDASVRALRAVMAATATARDAVGAEISQLARRTIVDGHTADVTLGASFDACG